jgi:hypothetical protein
VRRQAVLWPALFDDVLCEGVLKHGFGEWWAIAADETLLTSVRVECCCAM